MCTSSKSAQRRAELTVGEPGSSPHRQLRHEWTTGVRTAGAPHTVFYSNNVRPVWRLERLRRGIRRRGDPRAARFGPRAGAAVRTLGGAARLCQRPSSPSLSILGVAGGDCWTPKLGGRFSHRPERHTARVLLFRPRDPRPWPRGRTRPPPAGHRTLIAGGLFRDNCPDASRTARRPRMPERIGTQRGTPAVSMCAALLMCGGCSPPDCSSFHLPPSYM